MLPQFIKTWEKMIHFNKTDPSIFNQGFEIQMRKVQNETYALFETEIYMLNFANAEVK